MQEIHERIKAIRKRFGFRQKEFAQILGISQRTCSNYETGRTMPSLSVFDSMSKQLEVNVNYLISGSGRMFRGLVKPCELISETSTIPSDELLDYFIEDINLKYSIMTLFCRIRIFNHQAILDDIHQNDADFKPMKETGKETLSEKYANDLREFIRYYDASPMLRDLILKHFMAFYNRNKDSCADCYLAEKKKLLKESKRESRQNVKKRAKIGRN